MEEEIPFDWTLNESVLVKEHFQRYIKAKRAFHGRSRAKDATRAMQAWCYWLLNARNSNTNDYDIECKDEEDASWYRQLHSDHNPVDSSRVNFLLLLYRDIRRRYPGEGIIIFSMPRRFLDVIQAALEMELRVDRPLFDGTVGTEAPEPGRAEVARAPESKPILITAGADGVGLTIVTASIIIQTEVWWNRNTEKEA